MAQHKANHRAVKIIVAAVAVMVVSTGATPNVAYAEEGTHKECTPDNPCEIQQNVRWLLGGEGAYWNLHEWDLPVGLVSLTARYSRWERIGLEAGILTGGAANDNISMFVWGLRVGPVFWVNSWFGFSLNFEYLGANGYDTGIATTFFGRLDLRFQIGNVFFKPFGLLGYGLVAQDEKAPMTYWDANTKQYITDKDAPLVTVTKQYEMLTWQAGLGVEYRF